MSGKRDLNVYFYKVEPAEISRESKEEYKLAEKELCKVFSLLEEKDDYSPVIQTNGKVDLFKKRISRGGLIMGTFTYIQLENIPPKQDTITKKTTNLELNEEEGLGYQTSYLFDPKTNIIMVVNRRPGVNISSITKFIDRNFDCPQYNLSPVIRPSRMQEFMNKTSYRKLRVKLAGVSHVASILGENEKSFKETLKATQELNSNEMLYEIRSDKNESLTMTKIRNFISKITGENSVDVKELKVWGSDEVNSQIFDFLTDRLKENIRVESSRFNNFRISEVYLQLEEKFNEHKGLLRKMYSI